VMSGTRYTAAAAGDTVTLQRLMERDRNLSRAEYFYAPPITLRYEKGMPNGADSARRGCRRSGMERL